MSSINPDMLIQRANTQGAYGTPSKSYIANMQLGGQLGTGVKITTLDAASPLVFNPAVILVTHTPTMWNPFPEAREMLKSLIETHAKTVTGIDFGYHLETAQTPVGHDGQEMKVPTRTTRGQVNPTFTFNEVTGNLVWNLTRRWIFDIQHPDTNASLMPALSDDDQKPFVMSSYSMSMMVIQFDPTMRPDNIIDAMFYTNMFPTETTDIGLERSHGTTKIMDRTIPFTGIVQHNERTREIGYILADALQMQKINFNNATPGATEVDKALSNVGLEKELEDMRNDFVETA